MSQFFITVRMNLRLAVALLALLCVVVYAKPQVSNKARARFILCENGEVKKYSGTQKALTQQQQVDICNGKQLKTDPADTMTLGQLQSRVALQQSVLDLRVSSQLRHRTWLKDAQEQADKVRDRRAAALQAIQEKLNKLVAEAGTRIKRATCDERKAKLELQLGLQEAELSQIQDDIMVTDDKILRLSKHRDEEQTQNADLVEEVRKLKTESGKLSNSLSDWVSQVQDLKDLNKECKRQKKFIDDSTKSTESKISDDMTAKAQLDQELANEKAKHSSLKAKQGEAASDKATADNRLKNCNEQQGKLNKELGDTNQKNLGLDNQLKDKVAKEQKKKEADKKFAEDFKKSYPNDKLVELGDEFYFFSDGTQVDQATAVRNCQQRKMTLVFPSNANKNNLIKTHIFGANYALKRYWTSGVRTHSHGPFVWVDAVGRRIPLTFTDWQPGEPNNYKGTENCLEIEQNHQFGRGRFAWNDFYCDHKFNFICEREKAK